MNSKCNVQKNIIEHMEPNMVKCSSRGNPLPSFSNASRGNITGCSSNKKNCVSKDQTNPNNFVFTDDNSNVCVCENGKLPTIKLNSSRGTSTTYTLGCE
jgi:hypothetical protein